MEAIKNYPQVESNDVQNDASKVINEYQHWDLKPLSPLLVN